MREKQASEKTSKKAHSRQAVRSDHSRKMIARFTASELIAELDKNGNATALEPVFKQRKKYGTIAVFDQPGTPTTLLFAR